MCRITQPYLEDLLDEPAVVLLERLLIRPGDVDADEVGVVLVFLPIGQTLQQDLDETETPAGETRGQGRKEKIRRRKECVACRLAPRRQYVPLLHGVACVRRGGAVRRGGGVRTFFKLKDNSWTISQCFDLHVGTLIMLL